MQELLEDVVL